MDGKTAIVLVVDGRFFSGTTKNRRLQTAWSLPGAKLFASWEEGKIKAAEALLRSKGKAPGRLGVEVVSVVPNAAREAHERSASK